MTFPLYPHGLFGTYAGLLVGTLVGVAFGFVLERAGFGRARNLAAQFYLTDLRVLKVMFSAIVTACVGMAFLAGIGVLDLALITVPETFLWPQLVGGLLLGAGFIVSGYCPGTGVVAVASGNLDAVAAIGGIMAGSLAFGFGYGPLESFYKSGAMGVVRIDRLLGVPISVVAAAVVAMAVGAFLGGEKLEAIFAPRQGELVPASPARVKVRVFSGFAVVAALALVALALPARHAVLAAKPEQRISAVALAKDLVASPQSWWVVDLRPEAVAEKGRLPGAIVVGPEEKGAAAAANLAATRKLVIYSQSDLAAPPEGVKRFAGEIYVLKGGYDAWKAEVLTAPRAEENPTAAQSADFKVRLALYARYTGAASTTGPARSEPRPAAPAAEPKKGGGC
ncbi:MAG: YeeE/YedE thiosulfate transporter family protein [Acidobacteriota bacterium]|nr:YeeE/YedE thiosulfate transporter family protein [Acidobacteriota bacterium]